MTEPTRDERLRNLPSRAGLAGSATARRRTTRSAKWAVSGVTGSVFFGGLAAMGMPSAPSSSSPPATIEVVNEIQRTILVDEIGNVIDPATLTAADLAPVASSTTAVSEPVEAVAEEPAADEPTPQAPELGQSAGTPAVAAAPRPAATSSAQPVAAPRPTAAPPTVAPPTVAPAPPPPPPPTTAAPRPTSPPPTTPKCTGSKC